MVTLVRIDTTGAVPYNTPQFVRRVANCCGFLVTNTGDAIAYVNDRILYPGVPGTNNGDSFVLTCNAGEVFLGNIAIKFGPGANPGVTVEQKFYVFDCKIVYQ